MPLTDTQRERERAAQAWLLKVVIDALAPLYWHERYTPWPRKMTGGTCHFLSFGGQIVGVTALHVLRAAPNTKGGEAQFAIQLRTLVFDPRDSLIDADETLDLATFLLPKNLAEQAGIRPISCDPSDWPPPVPEEGCRLVLGGFPELLREQFAGPKIEFGAYGALTRVAFANEENLTIEPADISEFNFTGLPPPPDGFDLSGASGGVALQLAERKGLLRWFPAGVIIEQIRPSKGGLSPTEIIRLRSTRCICPDGTILHPSKG